VSRKQSELSSFRNAVSGIAYAFRSEPHMRFHVAAGAVVFALAALLRLPAGDWLWLLAAVAAVWTAELFNTAIERAVDLVSQERNELAKAAKDTASGATLVASLFAAAVGLIVLGPPLWRALFGG